MYITQNDYIISTIHKDLWISSFSRMRQEHIEEPKASHSFYKTHRRVLLEQQLVREVWNKLLEYLVL